MSVLKYINYIQYGIQDLKSQSTRLKTCFASYMF